MNVIKCINGHHFDRDSYDRCPHCGTDIIAMETNWAPPPPEKKGIFGAFKKNKSKVKSPNVTPSETPPQNYISPSSSQNFGKGDTPTEPMSTSESKPTRPLEKNPTLDFWQMPSNSENGFQTSQVQQDAVNASLSKEEPVKITAVEVALSNQPVVNGEEQYEIPPQKTEQIPQSALREAVKKASANSQGKTMSYFSAATSSTGQNQPKQAVEPAVGWLVCVKGYKFGECFSIFAGQNSIGRTEENRVIIADDNSISRVKHAIIVYEPKKRNFYLQPGDSSGLTYLNDEYITESKQLTPHDMIELGESKFMFVPLCGENFSWEDYIPKGE